MNTKQKTEVIYPITIVDLQNDAIKRIGRELTDDELYIAKKCVESGLSCVLDITLKAAIEEAVNKNSQTKCRRIQRI
ncbi:hypothetical protein A2Y83_04010 [Candidatus Falkowbacteria bacterium RBG_13_39_14]|uniref:Uncharacterized protein n=1 Tax=Candidatus Falkowbacteria bacterium RBG_13_39_14 TaxID=1797985 RepID=A0A1F5S7F4_9BACT|nr:MAG: hypothetical protein A2Y83_04010 [Candidatus Falkowbacteria bacterium RBG_13_39_14]